MLLNQIYKCSVCGNIVELVHVGGGTLVCCGKPMGLLKENSVDAAYEKHVPVIEKGLNSTTIKVGSVAHPMEPEHYIEWIELLVDDKVDRQYLKPCDRPEAHFNILGHNMSARAYCNLHGLWKSE
ncbi:MAG: hypothetical protein ACD_58C00199G0003 [uncultured bacterium]|nr:MAG: hypothetical protein ACD_58C00199G0003 [uncultured bacterium]